MFAEVDGGLIYIAQASFDLCNLPSRDKDWCARWRLGFSRPFKGISGMLLFSLLSAWFKTSPFPWLFALIILPWFPLLFLYWVVFFEKMKWSKSMLNICPLKLGLVFCACYPALGEGEYRIWSPKAA